MLGPSGVSPGLPDFRLPVPVAPLISCCARLRPHGHVHGSLSLLHVLGKLGLPIGRGLRLLLDQLPGLEVVLEDAVPVGLHRTLLLCDEGDPAPCRLEVLEQGHAGGRGTYSLCAKL